MKKKIIGIGAGGHAKVIIDALRLSGAFNIVGLLDEDASLHGTLVNDIPVLGGDDMMDLFYKDGIRHAFIGVGGVSEMSRRQAVCEMVAGRGFAIIGVMHARACVAHSAIIDQGAQIMAAVVINADVRIGKNVIVNTGAIVEHDCTIGMCAHIATGAIVTGGVNIGPMAFIGAGAVIKNSVRVGKGAVVGAGAVVIRDVPDNVLVAGVPACPIKLDNLSGRSE